MTGNTYSYLISLKQVFCSIFWGNFYACNTQDFMPGGIEPKRGQIEPNIGYLGKLRKPEFFEIVSLFWVFLCSAHSEAKIIILV